MRVKRDLCEFGFETEITANDARTNIGMLEIGSVMIEEG
jgi:hypothetical protein